MADVLSMTGFGYAAAAGGDGASARVEIKCVNHRGLKLSVRSRPSLGVQERKLRDLLAGGLARGAVDVYVTFQRPVRPEASGLRLDAARAAVAALRDAARELGLAPDLAARDLAVLPGLWELSAEEPLSDAEWPLVERAAADALAQTLTMRRAEGAALARTLAEQADAIEAFAAAARDLAQGVVERARARLAARLAELAPEGLAAGDKQALEREICLFADRADVREELDRLASHVEQYRETLRRGGAVGKRLEFLAQECLREVNTAASKAGDHAFAQAAVEAKLAVESIKEQVANLE